jgi:hypothetical protein
MYKIISWQFWALFSVQYERAEVTTLFAEASCVLQRRTSYMNAATSTLVNFRLLTVSVTTAVVFYSAPAGRTSDNYARNRQLGLSVGSNILESQSKMHSYSPARKVATQRTACNTC